jgi:hypothetical protein
MAARRRAPLIVGVSVTGTFWLIAGALLLASWRSDVTADRARNAPICARSEMFTGAACQITVPGRLTKITWGELDVTVDGRSMSSVVTLHGNLPRTPPAIPVEVTLYRGRVIHVEGETHLSVDTDAAPSIKSENYRNFGYCFVVFGAVFGTYATVRTIQNPTLIQPDE